MKKTLTILVLLFSLTAYSQNKSDIIILKIQQNYNLQRVDSYIRISYPAEKTNTIELAKAGFRSDDAQEDSNTKIIHKVINELTMDGYEILSSSITGDYQCTRTIIIFERRSK